MLFIFSFREQYFYFHAFLFTFENQKITTQNTFSRKQTCKILRGKSYIFFHFQLSFFMTPIETRITEICQQVEEQDISRASRRILDLFLDYHLPRNLKLDAVNLRASYNDFAALERANATEEAYAKLVVEAQTLLNKIQENCAPAKVEIPENKANIAENKTEISQNLATSAKGNVVFSGKNITKSFHSAGHSFHLPPLDLELRLGEITGIVGENGNGKTTLMRMVAGDLETDNGQIAYPFFPVKSNDWYAIKNRIAYIPQHIGKWSGYLKTNLHFNAAIHGLLGEENEEQVNFIIHRLGLTKYEDALWIIQVANYVFCHSEGIHSGTLDRHFCCRFLLNDTFLLFLNKKRILN
jgi:ABC-type multidrug transport system fused ATPase/permease subunit